MSRPEVCYKLTEQQQAMASDNLAYAKNIARRYAPRFLMLDSSNVESAAGLASVYTAHHFDPSRGVPYRALLAIKVRGILRDEARKLWRERKVRVDWEETFSDPLSREHDPADIASVEDSVRFFKSRLLPRSKNILDGLREGKNGSEIARDLSIHNSQISEGLASMRRVLARLVQKQ